VLPQCGPETVVLALQTLGSFDLYTGNEDRAYDAVAAVTRLLVTRLLHDQARGQGRGHEDEEEKDDDDGGGGG
jgi:hypothetical protein